VGQPILEEACYLWLAPVPMQCLTD
jgi:hypothetical protein